MRPVFSTLPVVVHALTLSDLAAPTPHAQWRDPGGIAAMSPDKLAALRANPLLIGPAAAAQLIATSDNLVVGRLDSFGGELCAAGRRSAFSWASNLLVKPEFRGQGIGSTLLMQLQSLYPAIGGCGLAQGTQSIYRRLGWAVLPVERFVMVRSPDVLVRAYVR